VPNPPRILSVDGVDKPLIEWSKLPPYVPPGTIRARIDLFGWSPADAVRTPSDRRLGRGGGRPAAASVRPVPALKRHASGQAYSRWRSGPSTLCRYFGQYGSPEAKAAYRRFAVEWADGLAGVRAAGADTTVNELALAYVRHATTYYRKDGRESGEMPVIRAAVRELLEWCGPMRVADVRRPDLEGWRSHLAKTRARRTVNHYLDRVRRLFKWGAGESGAAGALVPADVLAAVASVRALQPGRSDAREPAPKSAVPWPTVEATLAHLSPDAARNGVLGDLVRVQWLAGMRPGEALRMRPADLDRTSREWKYTVPGGGKNAHRGQAGVYWLGPRAKKIISRYLDACPDDRPVFALPPRSDGRPWVRLSRDRYRRLVALACRKAGVPHWHPHQIRHSRSTEVGQLYESDRAAADAIGTSEDVAREVYRGQSDAARRRIARRLG
jgi:integrase